VFFIVQHTEITFVHVKGAAYTDHYDLPRSCDVMSAGGGKYNDYTSACDWRHAALVVLYTPFTLIFTDFVSLDLQLNELNSALDALEQKNDDIHARLMELLESNREARRLFQKNLSDEQKLDPKV
jgi:hypothetical protein